MHHSSIHRSTLHRLLCLLAPVAWLLVACLSLPARDARANGAVVRVASGSPGGSYHDVYAANLARLLAGFDVKVLPTTGTGENLERLVSGEADLGFAQTDVYADRLLGEPDRYGALQVLGKVAEECVYLAGSRKGPVRRLAQLGEPVGERQPRVALGRATSGMRGTWRYMVHLMPQLARADVFDDTGTLAINRLALGAFDAVGWVTDPENLEHEMLRAVLAHEDLELMNVDDPALTGKLANGIQVYHARKVETGKGRAAASVKTICTSGLLLASAGADPQLVKQASDLLALHLDELRRPAR